MRLKFLMLLGVMFICSLAANAQMAAASRIANEMNVTGSIKGAGDVKVTVTRLVDNKEFATTQAKNGVFSFKSTGSVPTPFILKVGDKTMYLSLQSGTIKITGDINKLQEASVDPLGSHAEYMSLLEKMNKAKDERGREIAMEIFMSENSHSWISVYCLRELHKKYADNTQKMRMLLNYVKHYAGGPEYDSILADVEKREKESK